MPIILVLMVMIEESTEDRVKIQVWISAKAAGRIRVSAADADISIGEVVTCLAEQHLPPAPQEIPLKGKKGL